ncbi:hypothetical protein PENTCL1PPCAC_9925, partial [Pristionchus entomophagus]
LMVSSLLESPLTDALSRAALPLDIIRSIVRMNTGECTESMRSISATWNMLINELLKNLPPVKWAYFRPLWIERVLVFRFRAEEKYFKQFEALIPKQWREETKRDSGTPLAYYRLPIDQPLTVYHVS